jgi:hypothetical protein
MRLVISLCLVTMLTASVWGFSRQICIAGTAAAISLDDNGEEPNLVVIDPNATSE